MSWAAILGLLFVTLKLCEIGVVATWSWWLVLLPFYAGFLLVFGILAFAFVVAVIAELIKGK